MAIMLHGSARTTPRARSRTPKVERKNQHLGSALWAESHYAYKVVVLQHDCICTYEALRA